MDSLNFYDIKAEKANAILRHNQLSRKIANLFRLVEALVVLVLFSRLSLTIPNAVKHSGGLLRDVSVFLFSPRFVFVLGNLIVVVLFAKSGQFSPRGTTKRGKFLSGHSVNDDLYEEFLKRSEKGWRDSHVVSTTSRAKKSNNNNSAAEKAKRDSDREPCLEIKSFVRSNSEVFSDRSTKKSSSSSTTTTRVLRRSQTEKIENNNKMVVNRLTGCGITSGNSDDQVENNKVALNNYPEDSMSGEEFRLKVEAFIARQQRFRMEEDVSGDEL